MKVIVILLAVLLAGCSNDQLTYRILHKAGYTEIQTHGEDHRACSEGDVYATKFTARHPDGHWTSGTVCADLKMNYRIIE